MSGLRKSKQCSPCLLIDCGGFRSEEADRSSMGRAELKIEGPIMEYPLDLEEGCSYGGIMV